MCTGFKPHCINCRNALIFRWILAQAGLCCKVSLHKCRILLDLHAVSCAGGRFFRIRIPAWKEAVRTGQELGLESAALKPPVQGRDIGT